MKKYFRVFFMAADGDLLYFWGMGSRNFSAACALRSLANKDSLQIAVGDQTMNSLKAHMTRIKIFIF